MTVPSTAFGLDFLVPLHAPLLEGVAFRLSESPRIRLSAQEAPPVELLRWLSRPLHPFETVADAGGAPVIEAPAGEVGGLWPALEWLDEILRAGESLFPGDGDRAFVQSLCAELCPQPLPPKPERVEEAFARVEAALGGGAFLDGDRPGTRDMLPLLATPFIQDAVAAARARSPRLAFASAGPRHARCRPPFGMLATHGQSDAPRFAPPPPRLPRTIHSWAPCCPALAGRRRGALRDSIS